MHGITNFHRYEHSVVWHCSIIIFIKAVVLNSDILFSDLVLFLFIYLIIHCSDTSVPLVMTLCFDRLVILMLLRTLW